ncbi:hypothetical protein EVAR_70109_1 [Eumeta japonica]|uniref:Uncharacterized protein n=1 Tax=Eumeta variegata TaxID=151549 RepID=A0A4C2A380_EUMVA|nr:hypothetical protein EVAR_70109_1 [Eumeta japonica]
MTSARLRRRPDGRPVCAVARAALPAGRYRGACAAPPLRPAPAGSHAARYTAARLTLHVAPYGDSPILTRAMDFDHPHQYNDTTQNRDSLQSCPKNKVIGQFASSLNSVLSSLKATLLIVRSPRVYSQSISFGWHDFKNSNTENDTVTQERIIRTIV